MSNCSTPIVDFLNEYANSDVTRLHMPGHKGAAALHTEVGEISCAEDSLSRTGQAETGEALDAGKTVNRLLSEISRFDITEITGADNLYDPKGIIKESEENAGKIFGVRTFYSTEGSSQAIKAMLYLAKKHYENSIKHADSNAANLSDSKGFDNATKSMNGTPYIIALGSCHKAFYHAAELLNIRVVKAENNAAIPSVSSTNAMNCEATGSSVTGKLIDNILAAVDNAFNPIGVFVTYPDYFGNAVDLKEIKNALSEKNIPLLVDGAHSAYFKFLDYNEYPEYKHPADCDADLCCTSAHKTLPSLTGTAYLHVNSSFADILPEVKHAMDLFGSSSPSYILMASLDLFNQKAEEYKKEVQSFCEKTKLLKKEISDMGFKVHPSDPLRITVFSDSRLKGSDFAASLREHKCEVECFDEEYVIMMLTPYNTDKDLTRIRESFSSLVNDSLSTKAPASSEFNCLVNFK